MPPQNLPPQGFTFGKSAKHLASEQAALQQTDRQTDYYSNERMENRGGRIVQSRLVTSRECEGSWFERGEGQGKGEMIGRVEEED